MPNPVNPANPTKPVNVLCLHGCNQNEEMFKSLLKIYIKLGEKQYNLKFHFTEALYDHPLKGKTWYNKALDVEEIGKIKYSDELTKECFDNIEKIIKENNINALLGFSQGGNVVYSYLSHRKNTIDCAVIMSGYALVGDKKCDKKDLNIPLLGVASEEDTIVPFNLNPTKQLITHTKGHKLPTSKPIIRKILSFLQNTKKD